MEGARCCRATGSTSSCTAIRTDPACRSGRTTVASGVMSPLPSRGPKSGRLCGHPSALCSSAHEHSQDISARDSGMRISCRRQFAALVFMWLGIACLAGAATPDAANNLGPYNLTFLEGGVGLTRPLAADSPALAANGSWSLTGWLQPTLEQSGDVIIAAVGGT